MSGQSGDAFDRTGFHASEATPFNRMALIVYTTLYRVEFAYDGIAYIATVDTKPFGRVELRVWRIGASWKWSAKGKQRQMGGSHRARNAAGYAAALACHDVPHTNPVGHCKVH